MVLPTVGGVVATPHQASWVILDQIRLTVEKNDHRNTALYRVFA